MADFEKAVEYVLSNEAGYVNRLNDHGGKTNFGITEKLLAKIYPSLNIETITVDIAKKIYQVAFWDPMGLGNYDQAIATAIFDTAVNEGQGSAVALAQRAVNVKPDGDIGSVTEVALSLAKPNDFIFTFVGLIQDRDADIVHSAPTQLEFLKGWLRRSRKLLTLTFKGE